MATNITKSMIESMIRETAKGGRREVIDRTAGLILRVGRRGAGWSWKFEKSHQTLRLTIGHWPEWSIDDAREVAGAATAMVRAKRGVPNDAWLQSERVRLGKADAGAAEPATPTTFSTWDFAKARDEYLAWVKDKRAVATFRDRVGILNGPELKAFEGRRVATIERREFAEVLAAVHKRGAERHAEHIAEVLRPMWTFLADDSRSRLTGVVDGAMERLKAPERSRRVGPMGDLELRRGQYVPPVAELARIVAIADAGVLSDDVSTALAMLVYLGQRRRMVASAVVEDFEDLGAQGAAWWVPASHRKTALARGVFSAHVVPVPPSIWNRIKEQIVRAKARQPSEEELDLIEAAEPGAAPAGSSAQRAKRLPPRGSVRPNVKRRYWLFPGARPRRWGQAVSHIHPDDLTHRVRELPDVHASAHEIRNGLATHGEAILGFTRAQTRLVLDHSEGGDGSDVTARYALHQNLVQKWVVMNGWAALIDATLPEAAARLPEAGELKSLMKLARKPSKLSSDC